MNSTRVGRRVNAPRASVYRALLDARAVAQWMVPTGMTSHVQAFDAREGGSFRISLTYDAPTETGKTTAHTDTYHGRFVKLVPHERADELVEFETTDPALQGEMTITIALADADGGTDVLAVHEGLPHGLPPADNEAGWRSSLAKLAALVEASNNTRDRNLSRLRRFAAGVLLGIVTGALFLGVGGRLVMHAFALATAQSAGFTLRGSLNVVFAGAIAGAIGGLVLAAIDRFLPQRRSLRSVVFAALCYVIATPGFRPRRPLVFALFAPAFFAYGVVLMLAWERFVRNRSLNATR